MENKRPVKKTQNPKPGSIQAKAYHGGILSTPDPDKCLDAVQLHTLEQSFRQWTKSSPRSDIRKSRRRILLIFLLIRYTGAKLSEVLGLYPLDDIDFDRQFVRYGRMADRLVRKVQLSATLCLEIREITADPSFKDPLEKNLNIDPGFVRRKFYERAEACKIPKQLGAPEILRKSRAVELIQNNVPLPAVQMILGHSTPNLTSSYVSFSEDDIQQVSRIFMDKESARKTSARNSFFGKIQTLRQGDIQTRVRLLTMGGFLITTIITNDSVLRLGLKTGKLITAEVKAPWVMLQKCKNDFNCSADNIFKGIVQRIIRGKITTEYIVQLSDGTRICSLVTTESCQNLALQEGDGAWIFFNGFSVVLLSE
ncbi:MAG: TOBE domain-containing protein [Proteobacteria bacterium]|nr:TOBE domain-containing protein [Pseudomonadota bacterium]